VAAGTVTLNWNNPGLIKPAKATFAAVPPIWHTGTGERLPDWLDDPFVTPPGGTPNPTA
jgi:hypothetical protein